MKILDDIIETTVGLLLIAYVGYVGVGALNNSSSLTTGMGTIYTLGHTVLPIIAVIVFLMIVVNKVKKVKSKYGR